MTAPFRVTRPHDTAVTYEAPCPCGALVLWRQGSALLPAAGGRAVPQPPVPVGDCGCDL